MEEYATKMFRLMWDVTHQYVAAHIDENARLELQWYVDNSASEKLDDFYVRFFWKYYDPDSESSVPFTCRNPSACAVATMREIYGLNLSIWQH